MAGGPSQFDTFDDKPELRTRNGQPLPAELTKGVKLAFLQNEALKCYGSKVNFSRCGKSGQNISDLLPHIQKIADDICIVRTQQTDQVNHDPAHMFMNTGTAITGRPSMGSWVSYGLGNIASNLPDFVVMRSGEEDQPVPQVAWNSGFLPGKHSGVEFYSAGDPLNYLRSPAGIGSALQRETIDGISSLNSIYGEHAADPEIRTRIAQYELAFKMQTSVPEVADFSGESAETRELYGTGDKPDGSFASNCLMARRMSERGVRFIQLYHTGWDHHSGIDNKIKKQTKRDRPRHRRPHHRSQAARHVGRHAGHLGRRVRTHPHEPGRKRTRPPHQERRDVPCRRRHPRRHHLSAKRTPSDSARSRIPSTSTISTPPCSTCSASITSSSPTNTRAAISASPMSSARWWKKSSPDRSCEAAQPIAKLSHISASARPPFQVFVGKRRTWGYSRIL